MHVAISASQLLSAQLLPLQRMHEFGARCPDSHIRARPNRSQPQQVNNMAYHHASADVRAVLAPSLRYHDDGLICQANAGSRQVGHAGFADGAGVLPQLLRVAQDGVQVDVAAQLDAEPVRIFKSRYFCDFALLKALRLF